MTRVEELMLKVAELSPSEKMEFLETVQREIEDSNHQPITHYRRLRPIEISGQ
jgi:hypothetical protein